MEPSQLTHLHPLLQTVIARLDGVAGEFIITPDNHIFFQPGVHIDFLLGAMDMEKEGKAAGVHIVIRKVRKRANIFFVSTNLYP